MRLEYKLREILKNNKNELSWYPTYVSDVAFHINEKLTELQEIVNANYDLIQAYKRGLVPKEEKDKKAKINDLDTMHLVRGMKSILFALHEDLMVFDEKIISMDIYDTCEPPEILNRIRDIAVAVPDTNATDVQLLRQIGEGKYRICVLINKDPLPPNEPPEITEYMNTEVSRIVTELTNITYYVVPRSTENVYNLVITMDIQI